jgi:glycosyltransferase involved in cell wall biosynthesis
MHQKILIITDNLREQINGVVTTFKNIESLALLDGYSILYLDPGQFLHFSCPGYPEVKLSLPWQIGKKIEKISPDYIHIATEGPIGLCARLYLDQRGYRYNTSYHTKFPEFLNEIYHIPTSWTYWYVRWFHKHSGRVLTTTETMVKDLKDHGFKGDIQSWTRGVDRETLSTSIKWSHQQYLHLNLGVLYVGRVSKEKNLDDLCCLENEFDITIVGDGPYKEDLMKKYQKVKFLGYKTGSELADCYAMADVFCFPSRTDTFGIVIIESLSLGTPVAAYPVPGPIDILEQDVNGHMSDNLAHSIRMTAKLDRDKVQKSAEKWTWDNCWQIFKHNLISIF